MCVLNEAESVCAGSLGWEGVCTRARTRISPVFIPVARLHGDVGLILFRTTDAGQMFPARFRYTLWNLSRRLLKSPELSVSRRV